MDLGAAAQSSEPRPASTGAPLSVQLASQGRVHPVLRQIAEHLPVNGTGSVEIRLNPDELGSVRMTLSPAESGLTVHIQADRAETLDLIKRNIEQLARDLAEAGYDGAAFSFAGDEQDARPGRDGERPATKAGLPAPGDPDVEAPSRVAPDGLDIRL
jgi:flagellar hook-length control protein FliK